MNLLVTTRCRLHILCFLYCRAAALMRAGNTSFNCSGAPYRQQGLTFPCRPLHMCAALKKDAC